LALLLTLTLAACGGGEDRTKAQVRLVNASTAHVSLDLVVDDVRVRSAVTYGNSADYAGVDPKQTATRITRAGATDALFSITPTLNKGDHYSLVAYENSGALRAVLLDDNVAEPDSGKTAVRVLNGAPQAGTLDVYLTTEDALLTDAGAVHAGAAAGTPTDLVPVDAATWRLRVTAADDKDDLRLDISGIVLANRKTVTLVITPGVGGVLVNALLLTQQGAITPLAGAQARVRAVAAVTDSGAVAAEVGGATLMNGTGSPAVGSYKLVPAGAASASVSVNDVRVTVPAADLTAGTDHSLLVWGPLATPSVSWIADDNRPPTVATQVKLRLVNGVAALPGALALTANFTPVADGVAAGRASTPLQLLVSNPASLSVTAVGVGTPLFSAIDQTLAAGAVYTLFVVGDADAATGILRQDR
jgi:hypothetical protein